MNNASKIILFVFIILAGLWCYDKFAGGIDGISGMFGNLFNNKKTEHVISDKTDKQDETPAKADEPVENDVYIYFLESGKDSVQFLRPVLRKHTSDKDKMQFVIEELLAGPSSAEQAHGIYNEIPSNVKLLSLKQDGDKVIINLSDNFASGGGSESIYSRMRQLIKTSIENTNKPVYLCINGKQADVIGGEGITVSQPLSEKSLDE